MAYTNRLMSILTERNSDGKGARTRGRKSSIDLGESEGPKRTGGANVHGLPQRVYDGRYLRVH